VVIVKDPAARMRAELGHESRGLVNARAPRRRRPCYLAVGGGELTAMTRTPDQARNQTDAPARLQAVRREIADACGKARRDPAEVTLVAVSKTFGAAAIAPVLAAGQRVFGENRVQEAMAKWPALMADYPASELHLVGPLQSNKAKEAVALFAAIHSVDRPSLCEALAREIARQGRTPLLFAEINTGGEPQKSGVLPQEADGFLARCRQTYGLPIAGLMCLPPVDEPPAPHFALTAMIARRNGLRLLSMGMSADFALAIAFGATHVRVGTAIFGERG
jgi:pyridoxal phosphate enzyme (YggS family)